ncbi:glycine--tRNA ligase [Patescibacteria group bacterium]|nr:glycine--tRNA ligase [Patescibacteria group bacterium]
MEKIVSLCKRRGFIFPSSEIYGGLSSSYDYGPLGVELKNNIKKEWWKEMVQQRDEIVGLDSAILMHPKIWEASGHLEGFTDPLVDCKFCKKRFRADHLLETKSIKPEFQPATSLKKDDNKCPECGGELTKVRNFNLMFKTFMGVLEDKSAQIYLRPETAQGIYVNFESIRLTTNKKIPFGIAQIGKAFRNEITPGNFIFRTREFEQMEMQYFIHPKEAAKYFEYWKKQRLEWYINLGLNRKNLKYREHQKNELAHYAKVAWDIEYNFPFDQSELEGIHNRGDFDLSRHQQYSGKDLKVLDEETKKEYLPHIIETSGGIDRSLLAFLVDAYTEIEGGRTTTTKSTKEMEVVLKLDKRLAPVKIAVLPLSKKENLEKVSQEIYTKLSQQYMCHYDSTQAIGRRYRRQDEIGTPYCVTVDFDSLEDKKVTVRDRDTMKQERIAIAEIMDYFINKLN